MAYQALYRKWRPLIFDDVIGQNHITDTIRNELLSEKIAHAYLFTGTRGTGKTTTAKIMSRAVNCLDPKDGNPCNECENCKAILSDICLDVQEIDAASHTGVDNIRDIIEQLQYSPSMGKYKVYIIDEVHSLSSGAFNALLKSLEEPPHHIIFILATTEVHKIPATILSRCQRFDFKTISIEDIVDNINKILAGENIRADRDALEYVAFLGNGSMRDSLSILDQCLAFKDNDLTVDDVTEVVGAVNDALLYEFASCIAQKDVTAVLRKFNDCVNSRKNYDNIIKGLLATFREIMMYKINSDEFVVSTIKKKMLADCAGMFEISTLVNYVNILTDCLTSFRSFASQRVLCECALIKLSRPEMNTDTAALNARIESLENKLALIERNGIVVKESRKSGVVEFDGVPVPEPPPAYDDFDVPVEPQQIDTPPQIQKAVGTDVDKIIANWNDVMIKICEFGKLSVYSALFGVKFSSDGNKLCITTDDPDKKNFLLKSENKSVVKEAIAAAVGIDIDITFESGSVTEYTEENDVFAAFSDVEKKYPVNFKLD